MSYPDIPLDPVNMQAATLLSRCTEPVTEAPFYLGLLDEAKKHEAGIASMTEQLKTRFDQPWRKQCLFNLKVSKKRLHSIHVAIYGMREFAKLQQVNSKANSKIIVAKLHLKATETAALDRKAAREASAELQRNAAKARIERIEKANTEDRMFLNKLKKVLRQELGNERYLEIIKKATSTL